MWADRIEGKTSKACWAPGSSAYTTVRRDAERNASTKSRACSTDTSVSCTPCSTKKSGASSSTWRMGEAASNSSRASFQLFWRIRGARNLSRISSTPRIPVTPATS